MGTMTQQEIIDKVTKKAIANGWKPRGETIDRAEITPYRDPTLIDLITVNDGSTSSFTWSLNDIIFDHDFLKALYDDHTYANFYAGQSGDTLDFEGLNWQGHLINMVLADDPLRYLERNMP
jgi:hypothetical protein